MDLISRQAAIEVIEAGRLTKLIDAETAINGLKALPSAQQWIPCSERLPDAGEYYFVTVQHFGWNCTEYRDIDIAKYEVDGWRSCHNVLAWMPLPKTWNGKQNEERKE